jgi:hypothetical protein
MSYPAPKGVDLVRVEREGIVQKNGIEVGLEEEITGVKIVFGYGTGIIRGQVKVENGDIADLARMFINIRRTGSAQYLNVRNPTPDSRGRFIIDGLQPGEYDVSLIVQIKPGTTVEGKPAVFTKDVKETIRVTNGTETQLTMLVTLTAAER